MDSMSFSAGFELLNQQYEIKSAYLQRNNESITQQALTDEIKEIVNEMIKLLKRLANQTEHFNYVKRQIVILDAARILLDKNASIPAVEVAVAWHGIAIIFKNIQGILKVVPKQQELATFLSEVNSLQFYISELEDQLGLDLRIFMLELAAMNREANNVSFNCQKYSLRIAEIKSIFGQLSKKRLIIQEKLGEKELQRMSWDQIVAFDESPFEEIPAQAQINSQAFHRPTMNQFSDLNRSSNQQVVAENFTDDQLQMIIAVFGSVEQLKQELSKLHSKLQAGVVFSSDENERAELIRDILNPIQNSE